MLSFGTQATIDNKVLKRLEHGKAGYSRGMQRRAGILTTWQTCAKCVGFIACLNLVVTPYKR